MNQNLNNIKQTQNEVENEFENALNKDSASDANLGNLGKNLKAATHAFNRSLKQNPIGNDIFEKIELDR